MNYSDFSSDSHQLNAWTVLFLIILACAAFAFNQISVESRRRHLGWIYNNIFLIRTCIITIAMAGLLYAQHRVESEAYVTAGGIFGSVQHSPGQRYAASAGVLGATVALLSLSHYVDGVHANHECSTKSKARKLFRNTLDKYAK